jgi:hypothetical protein
MFFPYPFRFSLIRHSSYHWRCTTWHNCQARNLNHNRIMMFTVLTTINEHPTCSQYSRQLTNTQHRTSLSVILLSMTVKQSFILPEFVGLHLYDCIVTPEYRACSYDHLPTCHDDTQVQSQNIGGQSGSGRGISPSIYLFPHTIPPILYTHSFIFHRRYIIE